VLNRLASPKDLRFDDFSNPRAVQQQPPPTKLGGANAVKVAGEGRAQ